MAYSVKEVANVAGISVRTLHYYDQIGLLKPAAVSQAGYRLYSNDDLERLQEILFFKELGFTLKEIAAIIESPDYDCKQALLAHKKLLVKKKQRLERIIASVERTIESIEEGAKVSREDMFDGFDMSEIEKYKEEYKEEVRQKYDKQVVDDCEKRVEGYDKNDWARIQSQGDEIFNKFAAAMDRGPDDPLAQEAAAEWRQHITDNFYECTLEIFRGLADLYVSDERFTKNIDRYRPGLAEFMRRAMHMYCERHKD